MTNSPIADQSATIAYYLERSGRDLLPLHRRFLQGRADNGKPRPGPLATFVRRGREGALDQYLLAHAVASARDPDTGEHDVRLHAAIWARAGGGFFDADSGEIAEAHLHAVSRNWKFLKDVRLIRTERKGRLVRVTLLADDGSGDPYTHVGEGRRGQQLSAGDPGYFQLPYAYWLDGWHKELDLAGKAVLLIALSLGDGFPLPANKAKDWYGISPATVERGLRQLREHKLLFSSPALRTTDPASPVGFTDRRYHQLMAPFGPHGHRASNCHPFFTEPVLEDAS